MSKRAVLDICLHNTIKKGEGIRVFYETLLEQNANSLIALKWCVEHGVHPTGFDPAKATELLRERLAKYKNQQKQSDSVGTKTKTTTKTKTKKGSTQTQNRKKGRRARSYANTSDFMSAADVGLAVDAGGYTEDISGTMGL